MHYHTDYDFLNVSSDSPEPPEDEEDILENKCSHLELEPLFKENNEQKLKILLKKTEILDLNWRSVKSNKIRMINNCLSKESNLTILELYGCGLEGDVCKILRKCRFLTSLDLGFNGISMDAIIELCKTVQNCRHLLYLWIPGNEIVDESIPKICNYLKNNRSLTHIDLDYNNITDKSVECISEFLLKNETMTILKLFRNKITIKGFERMLKLVKNSCPENRVVRIFTSGDYIETSNYYLRVFQSITSNEIVWFRNILRNSSVWIKGILFEVLNNECITSWIVERKKVEFLKQLIIHSKKENWNLRALLIYVDNYRSGFGLFSKKNKWVLDIVTHWNPIIKFVNKYYDVIIYNAQN